jgi:1-acyl-sn-glycerol-3-phosphate acyltransferase
VAGSPVHEKGNAWLTFCQIVMYPSAFLLGRKKIKGMEKIQLRGGYLLVANHISHLDPLYDSVVVRKAGRVPRFLAKASLWKVPVLGRALAGSDQIPVERTGAGAGQASLEKATDALRRGRVVLIYPEGTVTRDPGHWPMKPRPGIGALALSGDFPVIPMAHWGTHQVYASYTAGRRFKPLPRKDIHIVFGDPIDLTELRSRPVDARSIRDASLLIMTVVRDMVAEIRGETPPAEFFDQKKAERLAKRAAGEIPGEGPGENSGDGPGN